MAESALKTEPLLFDDLPVEDLGTISIRVFVLPPKDKKGAEKQEALPLDVEAGEEFMLEGQGATPVSSYLEASRGKRCVVFLVNGQRQEFDDNTYLLLRPHYLNRIHVPGVARHRTLDVSRVQDVNLLYHAADVLVTDYSSVMFDFALLRKPIVFYTFDYAEYLSTRGTYVDLIDIGPGPFVSTTPSWNRSPQPAR